MGYIKSLGIIILMIHLTQTQQVDQEEVLEGDQGGQYTSIDNDDLYARNLDKLRQGQYLYPVILRTDQEYQTKYLILPGHNVCRFRTLL